MDLFEYQGKQYFARFDIPVSPGGPADTVEESVKVAEASGYPVVVKAQVEREARGVSGLSDELSLEIERQHLDAQRQLNDVRDLCSSQ